MRACLSVASWQACVQYCTAFFWSVEITFFLAEGHVFLGTAGGRCYYVTVFKAKAYPSMRAGRGGGLKPFAHGLVVNI